MRSVSCFLAIVLATFLLCACGAKDEPRASVESVVQENWPQFSDAEYDETAGTLRLTQESTMTYASAQKFGGEATRTTCRSRATSISSASFPMMSAVPAACRS